MRSTRIGYWLVIIAAVLALTVKPAAAQGQTRLPVQLSEGSLQLLDCDESVFMFSTPGGTVQFKATRLTAFFAGADRLDQFCALTPFLGTRARVWWASVDGVRVAGRIQVPVFPAQAVVSAAVDGGDHDDAIGASDNGGSGDNGGGSGDSGGSGGGDSGGGSGGGDSGGGSGGGDSGGGSGGGGGAGGHGNDKDRGHGNEDDGQKGSKGEQDPDNPGKKKP